MDVMRNKVLIILLTLLPVLHGCPFCDHTQSQSTVPFFIDQEHNSHPDLEVDELLEL